MVIKKSFILIIFLTAVFLSFLPFLNLAEAQVKIENPLKWDTIEKLIQSILVFLRILALAVTPIVIILAGYYFVTSMGDPAKITLAKKMVLYALIGLAIILMSEAIVVLIEKVIKGT